MAEHKRFSLSKVSQNEQINNQGSAPQCNCVDINIEHNERFPKGQPVNLLLYYRETELEKKIHCGRPLSQLTQCFSKCLGYV